MQVHVFILLAINKKRLRSTPEIENKMLRNLDENIKIC